MTDRSATAARLRVTVLGSAGSYPGHRRACASYLLEADGFRLLLDHGNGAMGNLLAVCDAVDVDAVLVSHEHPDHWADVVGLYIARRWGPDGPAPLPLYGPAGLDACIGRIMSDPEDWSATFPFTGVKAGQRVELGPFRVDFHEALHPTETLASRIALDDIVVAYTADSGVTDTLLPAARGADILLADCTWPARAGAPPDMHMTGAEAGALAARAGADLLVCTHVLPLYDPAELAAEAAQTFSGRIHAAHDLMVLER
jgi:ribonuclease BN (tRNA processing enzyme)